VTLETQSSMPLWLVTLSVSFSWAADDNEG